MPSDHHSEPSKGGLSIAWQCPLSKAYILGSNSSLKCGGCPGEGAKACGKGLEMQTALSRALLPQWPGLGQAALELLPSFHRAAERMYSESHETPQPRGWHGPYRGATAANILDDTRPSIDHSPLTGLFCRWQ